MSTPNGGRPAHSEQSQRWLAGVRAQVKARLFDSAKGIGSAKTLAPGPPTELGSTDVPARIGRFVVIKRIGQGGMGVIYAAYDDQLDRKIAVKLLRPDGSGGTGTDGRARLMREAQALARLSHESVIAVYEVGTYQDQVYVAMEFVDGGTLKQWQAEPNRPWGEILATYVRAGRGVAAAHAASIVHRDFKPDNVLVRRDGAVRVVDFGLARREFEGPTRPQQVLHALSEASGEIRIELAGLATSAIVQTSEASAAPPLTRTGTIMGTPAYMAPEQHLGVRADARSDQFSYCVALYEALYGFRPFQGVTLPALRRNVLMGNLQDPPKYTDVPLRVHAALARGLAVDPDTRHATMEALLEALTQDPRQLLRRVALGVLTFIVVAVAVGMVWADREKRDVHAVGQGLRQRFDKARVASAEAQLRKAQSRSVSEKWDDLVLAYARSALEHDPTRAVAALKHLTSGNDGWVPGARTIAADALRHGIAYRHLEADAWGGGSARHMLFSGTGTLFFASTSGVVYQWSEGAPSPKRIGSTDSAVRGLSVSDDATRVAAVSVDGRVHLWSLGTPEAEHRVLEPIDGPLTATTLSADGSTFVTGSRSGTVRIRSWSGETRRAMTDHSGAIRGLALSTDATMLASGSDDSDVILWYLGRKKHLELGQHAAGVRQVFFDSDDSRLRSVGEEGEVRHWSTDTGVGGAEQWWQPVRSIWTAANGSVSLAIGADQTAHVIDNAGKRVKLLGLPGAATAAAVTHDGTRVAVATADGAITLWKLAPAGADTVFPDGSRIIGSPGAVTALAWDARGRRIATGSHNGSVDLWQADGVPERQLGQIARGVITLAFAPSSHTLAGLDTEGVLLVWPVTDAPRPQMAIPDGDRVEPELAWSSDSTLIAVGECKKRCTIVLHELDGSVRARLPQTPRPADRMRFSADDQWLVSEHDDGPRLWDLTREEGVPLSWPQDAAPGRRVGLVFTQDGQHLRFATATASRNAAGRRVATTLRVWQAGIRSGDVHLLFEEPELSMLLSDAEFVTLLLRTHDGRTLLWTLDDDTMRMLPGVPAGYDHLLVAPGREALLLLPGTDSELEPRWTHVRTGQSRSLPPLRAPIAWSSRGVLADIGGPFALRLWLEATPSTVPAFRGWLEATTDFEIDPSTIR